jgi:hypothetical protein
MHVHPSGLDARGPHTRRVLADLMMHELAERKIAGGDRRKHRTLDVPLGL